MAVLRERVQAVLAADSAFPRQRPVLAASVGPHEGVRLMSQGTFEYTGGHVFELARLNRALGYLARPGSREEWLSPLTREDLIGLGVFDGGRAPLRQELIERLWSRKRQLLRQATAINDSDPVPPVA
jgi:hypothetical protein